MWAGKRQRGITLVEVVATIMVISILGIFITKVLFEDLEYRRLNDAVHRAQIIGAAIEYGREVGIVNGAAMGRSLTLGEFKRRHSISEIEDHMPELLNEMAFLDQEPDTFFRVWVSDLSTLVTISTTREHLFDVTIPSTGKTENRDAEDNSLDGINLTVAPLQGHGLFSAYAKERYINQD